MSAKKRKKKLRTGRVVFLAALAVLLAGGVVYGGYSIYRRLFPASEATDTIVPPKDVTAENVSSDHTKQMEQIREAHALDTVSVTGLTDEEIRSLFYSSEIDDKLLSSMQGQTWSGEQDFIKPEQLRYIRVLYKNFDGGTSVGEIIMNESLAEETEEIFYDLYMHDYPIERMILPDAYGGSSAKSAENNNTTGFNIRQDDPASLWAQAHALGLAIDLNPLYNPYVVRTANEQSVTPASAEPYADRTNFRQHMIDKNDYAYQLLTSHGFTWGGSWTEKTDYAHFEKNYTPPADAPAESKPAAEAQEEQEGDDFQEDSNEESGFEDSESWSEEESLQEAVVE